MSGQVSRGSAGEYQADVGFSRQEYWNVLPFPSQVEEVPSIPRFIEYFIMKGD